MGNWTELNRITRGEGLFVAAVVAVSSVLMLANLGNQYLWQDEAQTALISETILTHGVPFGYDGKNFFSQELGSEYGDGYIWKWHTWLSFYFCAASFWLFGTTNFAARLPFALFAIGCVPLTWYAAKSLCGDRLAAGFASGWLALSVPFLILGRQCRYYSVAAFFSLATLLAFRRLLDGRPRSAVWVVVLATLLFHTHYIYCATTLATFLAYAVLFERSKLRDTMRVCGFVAAVNAPWILWFSTIRYFDNYGSRVFDMRLALSIGQRLTGLALEFAFSPLLLLIPLGIAAVRWRRHERVFEMADPTRHTVGLLVLFCVVNLAVLTVVAPSGYFRYVAPLFPPLAVLAGIALAALARQALPLAIVLVAVVVGMGRLPDFFHEITHDFDGPIEGIVTFLQQKGQPDDTVAVTYGDMPLKFYTEMRVIGPLTGEDLSPVLDAEWVIVRADRVAKGRDDALRAMILPRLNSDRYTLYEINYPDTPFENREDPNLHHFRTVTDAPRVRIFRKKF